MADKTLNDIIKLRDEARKRMTESMAVVAEGGQIDSALAVRELDRIIAAQDTRLEATRAAMANSMSRFENEVKFRESRIAELKDLRERFVEGGSSPGSGLRLRDVKGIGPVAEERLHKSGITSVKVFAETPAVRIAEILGRDEDAAKGFLSEAKRLLK
jgi:predicted flap endonuclease-1-like 5' DNA nuclease